MLLHPKGPYPILIVSGESGSAKATFCETVRQLVDPSTAELNLVPSTERDVIIATNNSWVVAYDNLSFVSEHVSNVLCCVATGMGFRTRTLYSNDNETIFQACRPQLFNGIGDIAHRDDLLQRAILISLDEVPKYRSNTAWPRHPSNSA